MSTNVMKLLPEQMCSIVARLRQDRTRTDRSYPLSLAQRRIWFVDQLQLDAVAGAPVYNIPIVLQLAGFLDLPALEQALSELVRRHESLRTTFPVEQGVPVQRIAPARPVSLPVVDLRLRSMSRAARDAQVQRLMAAEAATIFDLTRGPLFRAVLIHQEDTAQLLLLTMHHIIADDWSIGVLTRELATLYAAFASRQPWLLPALPLQYADHAQEQHEQLQGEPLDTLLSYWKAQLRGMPPSLALPTDRPRPAQQSCRGETLIFAVPAPIAAALNDFGRRTGATLFMTLLAAFMAFLHRYSRQEDIVVGTLTANRNRAEIEPLIGLFVNTLVLRADLSGNPSFHALVERVREVVLGAYAHQDLPFERLVEELQPEQSFAQSPLFQVLFALQDMPTGARQGAQLGLVPGAPQEHPLVIESAARFDLSLRMGENERGLTGELEYSLDLFERSTALGMLRHFQNLLAGIAANPEQRLSELPLLDEAERHQMLVEWNTTWADVPRNASVYELFVARSASIPDAIAVTLADQELTYRELTCYANQLAHHLQGLGIGPDVRVGICMERSLEMAVAVLGVLAAGGCYVPLDPGCPRDQLGFLIEDAEIAVVLTQRSLVDVAPAQGAHVIVLDRDWKHIAEHSSKPPMRQAGGQDLAHVMFTASSTGRPRGIAMPQRPLVNAIAWQVHGMPRHLHGARTLQLAPLGCHVSFQEMLTTWCSGGMLVLITEEACRDPELLLRWISDQQVERLFLPPAVLQQLAETAIARGSLPLRIREIIAVGEPLTMTQPIAAFVASLGDCIVRHHYGLPESPVATEHVLTGSPEHWPVRPPIGKPIANARIYILDPHGQPVPVGVPGELHIGGEVLARGYLRRPQCTSQDMDDRFVADPFSPEPGARMYRTGDLARYRLDGTIEHLGKLDPRLG